MLERDWNTQTGNINWHMYAADSALTSHETLVHGKHKGEDNGARKIHGGRRCGEETTLEKPMVSGNHMGEATGKREHVGDDLGKREPHRKRP